MNELPPDVLALVNTADVDAASAAYQAAHSRITELREKLGAATEKLNAAVAERRTLVARAAAGETVKLRELSEAELSCREAELPVELLQDAIKQIESTLPALDRKIAEARGLSWRPVLIEGARRRLAAAKRAEEAMNLVAKANAELTAANEIVSRACTSGAATSVELAPALARERPRIENERAMWRTLGVEI